MADKRRLLVDGLIAKTEAGAIPWEATAIEGTYQATFTPFVIQLYLTYAEGATAPDIVVRIQDYSGTTIDEVSDRDFSGMYTTMLGFYNRARRKALGADEAIDEILKRLGGDDIPF